MKLLIIVANLVLVRIALATSDEQHSAAKHAEIDKPTNLDPQQVAVLSTAALEHVNSLDFASSLHRESEYNQSRVSADLAQQIGEKSNLQPIEISRSDIIQSAGNKSYRNFRKLDNQNSHVQGKQKRHRSSPNFSHLLLNLLEQLEKVDVKKIISDSLSQSKLSATKGASNKSFPVYRDSSTKQLSNSTIATANKNSNSNSNGNKLNNTIEPDHPDGRAREGFNASVLGGDTGNLLSITKQLVKLARNQMVGGEYGSTYPSSSSWFSPLVMPSMLSAASHMLHDSNADFTAASLKSDWFWVVVPAVIVIGAGVIVVPLIAAWLVSNMMNQNTFTVSAGRRRRRRKRDVSFSNQFNQEFPNQTHSSIHEDLFKMLDIHRLLDDAPQLLVDKLSRFYTALDSVGSTLGDSAFNKAAKIDDALDSKLSIFKKTLDNK